MEDFNAYQDVSRQTAQGFADPLDLSGEADKQTTALFLALAINGEAGEIGEKVKKYVREGDEQYLRETEDELGDVLWYLTQLSTLLGKDLGDVAEDNLDKLLDRQERGVITGQGDNR